MQPLIQCVPNFSEGRDLSAVKAIVEAARRASSVKIADYSSDPDHNRMVLTLLGNPGEIRDSMFAAAEQAVASIDMRSHEGVHPRIGAIDVVPVVPIRNITMQECIDLSYQIGNDIAHHLHVPVYFYEASAVLAHRENLAVIRRGGYEALAEGELLGERAPDLGPNHAHPTAGATVVGARGPLLAYNINLKSDRVDVAKAIAKKIRIGEAGFQGVKSIGLWLASRGQAQVSMNITKPELTTIDQVYTFIESEARKFGVEIAESEVIGCVQGCHLDGTSPEDISAHSFKRTQVLDSWYSVSSNQ